MINTNGITWTSNPTSNPTVGQGIVNGAYVTSLNGSMTTTVSGAFGPVGQSSCASGSVPIIRSSSKLNWGSLASPVHPSIRVSGDAEFDGDVKIKGKSLSELIERIEARLGVIHPNDELEERWEELRQLSVRYKELEAEIKEKEQMWAILKR